jgi:hypothetical protein
MVAGNLTIKEAIMATDNKPVLRAVSAEEAEPVSIARPDTFSLDAFKSKRNPSLAGVETLQMALPHHKMADANDYVRLHPDEENYWSDELCFVNVPIKGAAKESLHLILEDLAMAYLPPARIKRFRLALGTKPGDRFFLCHVPSQNLDNAFNKDNLTGCEQAKRFWTQATSRKEEGVDGYKVEFARDNEFVPPPSWPSRTLDELIEVTFTGRMIMSADHPGLLRLIGAKQSNE